MKIAQENDDTGDIHNNCGFKDYEMFWTFIGISLFHSLSDFPLTT